MIKFDDDGVDRYSFIFNGNGRSSHYLLDIGPEDDPTWGNVLDNFLWFLSSVYGYDFHDKVKYECPSWHVNTSLHDNARTEEAFEE